MFGNKTANKEGEDLAKKLAKDEALREVIRWKGELRSADQKVQRYKHSPEHKSRFEDAVREATRAQDNLEHWMRKT